MQDARNFSLKFATAIGHISRRLAIEWAREGIFVPSLRYGHNERPYVFHYSFQDLIALRVIWILRQQFGLSLRAALPAAEHVRAHADIPWNDLHFWVLNQQVEIANPESDAAVLVEVAPIAEQVKVEADKLWYRNEDDFGKTEYRRDVMGGTLVVKGTRISVATVVNMTAQGANEDEILRAYPSLVPEDIRGVLEQVAEQRRVA